jgi:trans-aconitate methyltransferase
LSEHTEARREQLDEIAAGYDPSNRNVEFDYYLKRLQAAALRPWLRGREVLELGCATGELSSQLSAMSDGYHVVEGSQRNIDAARARVPTATFVHSLWEHFEPEREFTDVVACNALEHADDPVQLLRRTRDWLEPGGRVHAVVPNGLSLHRLVGVEMGLLRDPLELTDGDRAQGHVRNYTIESLRDDLAAGGFEVAHSQGIFLKLVPNREMLGWDWDLIQAIDRVGRQFPEHSAELYVVGQRS